MGRWNFSGASALAVVALAGNGGRMGYSYDGINWVEGAVLSPTFDGFAAVCTASGEWLLGGRDGVNLALYRSNDGINWTSLPSSATGLAMDSYNYGPLAFFNGRYLLGSCLSALSGKLCRTTSDFVTYADTMVGGSPNPTFGFANVPQGGLFDVASNGSVIVVCGQDDNNTGRINYSVDAITALACTYPLVNFGTMRGICFSPILNRFVCGGNALAPTKNIVTSPDGITFTEITAVSPFPLLTLNSVAWGTTPGNFCAVFDSNSVAYSSDGDNWTGIVGPFPGYDIKRITYSNTLGLFIAVAGGTGQIATSPTGAVWTGCAVPWSTPGCIAYGVGYTYGR